MKLRFFWELLRDTVREWNDNKASRLGAALAYYAIFSIAPVLMIALAITSQVYGAKAARGEVFDQIKNIVGVPAARAIEEILATDSSSTGSTVAAVIGIGLLVFGASGVFIHLQDALNTIWKVTPKPGRVLLDVLRERALSFAVVVFTGALLLASVVVNTALAALSRHFPEIALPGSAALWQVLQDGISLLFTTVLFAIIYKMLPDVRLGWRDVWIGAVVTAVLFTAGKFLLGLYLGWHGAASSFGACGSLVVILLWVYYSSQIFLFGAAFTHVYTQKTRPDVEAADNAVPAKNAAPASAAATDRRVGSFV